MTGCVVWFTGLPASGKSTLAAATARALRDRGTTCVILDGDSVRAALVPTPGYSAEDRDAFYETLARLAALIAEQDVVVLVPATAHLRRWRDRARALAPAFVEVFVDTPLEECRRRDRKGLYRGEHAGAVPGGGVEYQRPVRADVVVQPHDRDVSQDLVALILALAPDRPDTRCSP